MNETYKLSDNKKEMLTKQYPNLKKEELEKFFHIIEQTGLDPIRKQIWVMERSHKASFETSIDGFRLIAERTGKYSPGKPTEYIEEEGKLVKATAYVKKMTVDGTWHEVGEDAYFSEFGKNTSSPVWKALPHVMLSKCAESRALRRAFPDALSGLYTKEEMEQAELSPENEEEQFDHLISFEKGVEIVEAIGGNQKYIEEFCKRLNIKSLRDIKESQLGQVYTWIAAIKRTEEKNNGKM
jgi:phage recombination protein Bet